MAYYVYVSISGEGRVDVYSMDPGTGSLDDSIQSAQNVRLGRHF